MSNELIRKNELLPAFMANEEVTGADQLGQYIVPPRLKIIQGASGSPFCDMFSPGDAVLVPQMIMVAPIEKNQKGRPSKTGSVFHITPVFFYGEWCLWNPLEKKGQLPAIEMRTTNPNDAMVTKCRDFKLRLEAIPGEYDAKGNQLCRRYVEHLNFISVIVDNEHELHGMPMVISFSRGDHKGGSNFAALLKLRKAPIFGCRFQCRVGLRNDPKGDWFGLDVTNPEDGEPWVKDEAAYSAFRDIHNEFAKAHQAGNVQVEYSDEEVAAAEATEF